MTEKTDWNPELYLKYRNERTQPSIDLVSRINLADPATAADIGCGPGNSTLAILNRWPNIRITGIDNSPAMIKKAKGDYPGQQWILADAMELDASVKYDLVFSNATIQWIPDHERLLDKMWNMLNAGGALAVQMPLYQLMPVSAAIEEAARSRWHDETTGVMEIFTFHTPDFYYNVLAAFNARIEMWVTSYVHVMQSHEEIAEMIKSTGMKPFLDRLKKKSDRQQFESAALENIKKVYPSQQNGRVLFPFKRMFFVAYK